MEHIEAKKVLCVRICPIIYQGLHSVHVTLEASQVQRRELVSTSARIDPLLDQIKRGTLDLDDKLYKHGNFAWNALEHSMMHTGEAFLIRLTDDWQRAVPNQNSQHLVFFGLQFG